MGESGGAPPESAAAGRRQLLATLSNGEIELRGRLPWSSNATFLVAVRPPPRGPGGRQAKGWGIVPPTTARADGPLGPGSLQYCVDALFDEHYFTLLETPEHRDDLRRMAAFDVVANNADRKSGHCLIDREGHIWGIDHGLCFHVEPKLRTVIWDFVGDQVDADLLADLGPMAAGSVPRAVTRLLGTEEIRALTARAAALRAAARFPGPSTDFPYPWPLV